MTGKLLRLKFLGEPVPKGVVRGNFTSGKFIGFKPKKTRNAMADLRAQLAGQLPRDFTPIAGPIYAKVIFFRSKPETDQRRLHPYTRPDLDNYLKLLWDALNTIAFKDDAQIVQLEAVKQFGTPGIELTLSELESHAPKPKRKGE